MLLGQDEIGEVNEDAPPGRGGSSAMPHKQNPTTAQQILAACARLPALAQTLLTGMRQEHERGISGWQLELPLLAESFVWAYDALVLAVGHDEFKALGSNGIRALGRNPHVVYDIKYVLPKDAVDARL